MWTGPKRLFKLLALRSTNHAIGLKMPYQHQTESDLQKQIIELLEFQGFLVMRINQGMDRRGGRPVFYAYWTTKDHETMTEGIADVIAFRAPSGRVLALEVKQPGEKARIAQKEFLQRVNLGGGIGRVVDSIDSAQSAINEYLLKE
jgi:hypothetical protein